MTRKIVALLALASGLAASTLVGEAFAQEPPAASAPEPKMPPMPSMEGQQGDVSKPVTQMPARKKSAVADRKTSIGEKKNPIKVAKPPRSNKGR